MIRIFPDFSVQVTAAAGAGAAGMPAARVPGATNGNPQNVQGLTTYQQRYATCIRIYSTLNGQCVMSSP
ncbi:neuronal PAS domain-containing protein 3 isoform X1 [Tachysurus ichikawai]